MAMLNPPRPLLQTPKSEHLRASADACRLIPEISPGQEQIFRILWALQYPLVVHGVEKKLQASWSPEAFASSYGAQNALMIDSRTPIPKKVTVRDFFTEFVRSDEERGGVIKLKVGTSCICCDMCQISHKVVGLAPISVVR